MLTPNLSKDKLAEIRWRCRRGILELDIMLQKFFDNLFMSLMPNQQKVFIQLLESGDQDLYDWFMGNTLPDRGDFHDLILYIRYLHMIPKEEAIVAE